MRGLKYVALIGALFAGASLVVACGGDDKKSDSGQAVSTAYSATVAATAVTSSQPTVATAASPVAATPTTAAPAAAVTQPPAAPAATPAPALPPAPTPTPQPPAPPAAAAPITLAVTGNASRQFAPAALTAKVGQAVTINFTADGLPHTWTIDGVADTGNVSAGSSGRATFTPSAAGALTFYCKIHGRAVMSGTLTVTP